MATGESCFIQDPPEAVFASYSVLAVLESHSISPAAFAVLLRDPFTADDFHAFISERQRTVIEAIESLLIKKRLDLSPRLRDLDQQIENIELALRERIAETLGDDPARLPPHQSEGRGAHSNCRKEERCN